jgi:hypothetical protein
MNGRWKRIVTATAIAGGLILGTGVAAGAYDQTPGPSGGWIAMNNGECSSANQTIQPGTVWVAPSTGYASQSVAAQYWFRDRNTGKWSYSNPSSWVITRNTATGVASFTHPRWRTTLDFYQFHKWDVVVRVWWRMANGSTVTKDLWGTQYVNQSVTTSYVATYCYA